MEVTIVQRPLHLMTPFDPDMAALLHNEVRRHGIRLALGCTVEGFAERDGGVVVFSLSRIRSVSPRFPSLPFSMHANIHPQNPYLRLTPAVILFYPPSEKPPPNDEDSFRVQNGTYPICSFFQLSPIP